MLNHNPYNIIREKVGEKRQQWLAKIWFSNKIPSNKLATTLLLFNTYLVI